MEPNAEIDTRRRILEAAGPVFATHGFDRATVRDICSAAGVNVASVGYYFGDKLGLYREVIQGIRDARERQYPTPTHSATDPRQKLHMIVRTILSRMLACDASGWESQLFMREMQSPTPVFESIVREFFRPLFDQLVESLASVGGASIPKHTLEQLALSVVGQCFYYKVGAGVVQILIPESERKSHYDIDSLCLHITAVMVAATENARVLQQRSEIELLSYPEKS
jgi:TetR/AcrR family transcriptional regulator, regulator of cefoperazone and chloramphenicol sensitivity